MLSVLRRPTWLGWLARLATLSGLAAVYGGGVSTLAAHYDLPMPVEILLTILGVVELPGLIVFMLFGGVHASGLADWGALALISVVSGLFWATLLHPFLMRDRIAGQPPARGTSYS
jgi:hypothetical protein